MSRVFNEPASGLYSINVTCLSCGNSFKTLKVRSRFATPQTIESDFCAHYKEGGLNPNHYFVNVCIECGFSFTEEFSQEVSQSVKALITKQISAKWEKRDFGKLRDSNQAIESYKLAVYSATLKKEKHAVLGGLCLRLAWAYREQNNHELEERFLHLALKEFEDSYVHSDFAGTSFSEMKVLYLAGELNRRLGQFQQAINYFSKVIEHPNRSQERRLLVLAREQWSIAAEEYRKTQ
ncbi:MAG: DUF2225 domain-containing protein [Desulfitobacteriaceae bacterium]